MKKVRNRNNGLIKYSVFAIALFFICVFIFLSCVDMYVSYAESGPVSTDIDFDRLKKAAADSKPKIDGIIRTNPGLDGLPVAPQPAGPPGAPQPAGPIPGNNIDTDLAPQQQALVGSAVKVRVKSGFSFGNGNIRSASLVWKTSDGQVSQLVPLSAQGGIISGFGGAVYDFRPNTAGAHTVSFEICYKIFGDNEEHKSLSAAKTIVFIAGNAPPGPGNQPGGNPADNFVPPPPGQNTPPGTVSKQIPINFSRDGGPPDINEREEYTWKWPHAQLAQPSSQPGAAYVYVVSAIKRGSEIQSNDATGISSGDFSSLPPGEQGNYIESGGRYYKKAGIDIGGDGPLPDSLNAKWKVRYPSVNPGSGGWSISYDKEKGSGSGDVFKFSMPEPSEPFKVAVAMKVEHTWRDYTYDKSPNQISAAIKFYAALKNNTDPTGSISGPKFRNIHITVNEPSCAGGAGQTGPLPISVTVSGNATYEELKKVGEKEVTDDQGNKHKEDIEEWVPGQKVISKTFGAGKVVHADSSGKTDESVVYEKVLDTTAPRIDFDPQPISGLATLVGTGGIICSSGDLINVRVKITDNNKYAALRTPYLTYETSPSGNNPDGTTWSGVPLMMEPCPGVPDNNAPRPFSSGNFGIFQALVPAPHNIKGMKALRWYVDAFDGSGFKQPQPFNGADCFGNFNHGNFEFDGLANNTHKVDPSPNKFGTLSIYDNDRPNIEIKMWKVDRNGTYLVGEFNASEDYFIEDFYYDLTNPSNLIDPSAAGEFKGRIPDDTGVANVPAAAALLGANSAGIKIPGALIFPNTVLFPAVRKQPIADNLKYQIEDAAYNFFKYHAGYGINGPGGLKSGNCPVIFEDVKYIFTVNAYDNIEGVANNGVVTLIPRPERTKVSFEMKDTSAQPPIGPLSLEFQHGQSGPVNSAAEGKLWYLGPEDPSIPLAAGASMAKEVPTFEYVFHSVSSDNSVGDRYLKIAATDRCGHKRHIAIYFKVSEVTNELRVLEEKIKREFKSSAK